MKKYVIAHNYNNDPKEQEYVIQTKVPLKELKERINFVEWLAWEYYETLSRAQNDELKKTNQSIESIMLQDDVFTNKIIKDILKIMEIEVMKKGTDRFGIQRLDLYYIWEQSSHDFEKTGIFSKKAKLEKLIKSYFDTAIKINSSL